MASPRLRRSSELSLDSLGCGTGLRRVSPVILFPTHRRRWPLSVCTEPAQPGSFGRWQDSFGVFKRKQNVTEHVCANFAIWEYHDKQGSIELSEACHFRFRDRPPDLRSVEKPIIAPEGWPRSSQAAAQGKPPEQQEGSEVVLGGPAQSREETAYIMRAMVCLNCLGLTHPRNRELQPRSISCTR